MMWFFAILIVLALGGVAVVAAGRGAPMAEVYDDRPDALVPADRPARRRRPAPGPVLARLPRLPDVGGRRPPRPARQRARRPPSDDAPDAAPERSWRRPIAVGQTAGRVDRVIVYVLTALAAVVIVLTRLRLGTASGGAGRLDVGRRHWSTCTPSPASLALVVVGGLPVRRRGRRRSAARSWASSRWPSGGSWSIAGLLILVRWLPSRGKHAVRAAPRTPGPRARGSRSWPTSACSSGSASSPTPTSPPRSDGCAGLSGTAAPLLVLLLAARCSRRAVGRAARRRAGAEPARRRGRERRRSASRCAAAPIVAYHLGEPGKRDACVLISTMHGDEPAHPADPAVAAATAGRSAASTCGWCRRTTPTGWRRGTRKNAHGVDLNRNFPYRWTDLDGSYESGPRAGLGAGDQGDDAVPARRSGPTRILSFHQPLHGVDTDTKRPRFARRVADKLDLPAKTFDCGGVCHGTMTMWFNHRFRGAALTVEYGAPPDAAHRCAARRPRQVLSIFGARRGSTRPLSRAAQRPSKTGFSLATNAATAAAVVGGRAGLLHHRALELQRLLEGVAGGVRHRLPHRAERHRRAGREPAGQRRRPRRRARRPAPPWWPARASSASSARDGAAGSRAARSPWPGRPAAAGGSWRRCRRRARRWRRRG